MARRNSIDIASQIATELQKYSANVEKEIDNASKETATEAIKKIKSMSPERRPKYKKGWRIKKIGYSYVLYNYTDYQLTHLLEYGHVGRDGKRVRGISHIKPNEEWANNQLINKIKKVLNEAK